MPDTKREDETRDRYNLSGSSERDENERKEEEEDLERIDIGKTRRDRRTFIQSKEEWRT